MKNTTSTISETSFTLPADGWFHIENKGVHPNEKAGVVQVLDDEACRSIVNRFSAEADQAGFPGMLIDHEHFKHDQDKETRAYGWLMRLQNRPDGIYGQIRWTETGRQAVEGGDYRFFSTEYNPSDLQVLNGQKRPRHVRPLRLDGLTLTNANNNKGQKPITNREDMNTAPIMLNTESRKSAQARQLAEQLAAATGRPFDDCWRSIRQAKPELFAVLNSEIEGGEQVEAPTGPGATATQIFHGRDYAGVQNRLRAAATRPPSSGAPLPGGDLEDAVKDFQIRHGIATFTEAWESLKNRRPGLFNL
ncbi:MAG TPA: phage protease [Candidatus Baltobacteraceae bacterium]|jgi:hypothetical protein|nr:phage protease [Candidatus Baltobacteraceae bacterium]